MSGISIERDFLDRHSSQAHNPPVVELAALKPSRFLSSSEAGKTEWYLAFLIIPDATAYFHITTKVKQNEQDLSTPPKRYPLPFLASTIPPI
ncbi:hypothetical protein FJTKL_14772 [Diaporthe vaccinii]|uniref:Uncharacterized protein n=1 Tax=Diaporthe vaccinii TaxID=105482 RepID=A0ABR4F802_9PEZI